MDLTTTYMGMTLKNPLVASAGPIARTLEGILQLEDVGLGAVVMPSLFEEEIKQDAASLDYFMDYGSNSFGEALTYFPEVGKPTAVADTYLKLVSEATERTEIPVIPSINGVSNDGWVTYATRLEQAGAKAIELNLFFLPTDIDRLGQDIEDQKLQVVKHVKEAVDIPVAVKLSPFFSNMGNMAKRFVEAGADALVLFNRFYQPDFNLDELEVENTLTLSSSDDMRLPLLWVALLHGRLDVSLAATRGIHTGHDALKYIMAGANVAMTTSALLKHGPGHATTILEQMVEWMEETGYESIQQMCGAMSQVCVADPKVFERANYIKILKNFKNPYLVS